jgi:hypothetical protein
MLKTAVPIYRVGSRRRKDDLLRVRNQDVTVYTDPAAGEICVRAQSPTNTPGISCWETQRAAAVVANGRRVWELPAGASYDETKLCLWQPRPDKWYWSPAQDMRGSEFLAALRVVNQQFQ